MNSASGTIIIHSESWASKEELYLTSFTKEEQLQRAYDNLAKAWADEKKARAEMERRERGDRRLYWD